MRSKVRLPFLCSSFKGQADADVTGHQSASIWFNAGHCNPASNPSVLGSLPLSEEPLSLLGSIKGPQHSWPLLCRQGLLCKAVVLG